MITNFVDETHELTAYELTLVPHVVKGLRSKLGINNAVTSTHICKAFKASGHKMSGPRLRKIINHIRITGQLSNLIATSKGYHIAASEAECRLYIQSLDQRINEITLVRDQMQFQLTETLKLKKESA